MTSERPAARAAQIDASIDAIADEVRSRIPTLEQFAAIGDPGDMGPDVTIPAIWMSLLLIKMGGLRADIELARLRAAPKKVEFAHEADEWVMAYSPLRTPRWFAASVRDGIWRDERGNEVVVRAWLPMPTAEDWYHHHDDSANVVPIRRRP